MPLVCPACNKAGQTAATCQRCGCDLSRLHAILKAAASLLRAAVASLANGNRREALTLAQRSWRLHHNSASAQVAFLAAAGVGDTPQALRWREPAAAAERTRLE